MGGGKLRSDMTLRRIEELSWRNVERDESSMNTLGLECDEMNCLQQLDASDYTALLGVNAVTLPRKTSDEDTLKRKPVMTNCSTKKKPKKKHKVLTHTPSSTKMKMMCVEDRRNVSEIQEEIKADMSAWIPFDLHDDLVRGLDALGFTSPTLIQQRCLLPAGRDRKHIVAAAETGSGKTLAFALPILDRVLKHSATNTMHLQALIVSPTRELALQIVQHFKHVAQFTAIKVIALVGGLALPKQRRQLAQHPEIVVGTPGRLWELIQESNAHLCNVSQLKFLVIDEADRMISTGKYEELDNVLEFIWRAQSKKKSLMQKFLFSATMTLLASGRTESSVAAKLMKRIKFSSKPEFIDVTNKTHSTSTLRESRINCTSENKDDYLYYFLSRYNGRTLVFVNTIAMVRRVHGLLTLLDIIVYPLHAAMQQRQRLKNLDRFRTLDQCTLICTDVAARGIDISNVQHVVHYQMPQTSELYVHRSGRTARAGLTGFSLALIGPSDLALYRRHCATLHRHNGINEFPVPAYELAAYCERIKIASKLDRVLALDKRRHSEQSWFKNAASECDIILDESLSTLHTQNVAGELRDARETARLRQELDAALKRPVRRKMVRTAQSVMSETKAPMPIAILDAQKKRVRTTCHNNSNNALNDDKDNETMCVWKPQKKLNSSDALRRFKQAKQQQKVTGSNH